MKIENVLDELKKSKRFFLRLFLIRFKKYLENSLLYLYDKYEVSYND